VFSLFFFSGGNETGPQNAREPLGVVKKE